jgi:hypothetical protein
MRPPEIPRIDCRELFIAATIEFGRWTISINDGSCNALGAERGGESADENVEDVASAMCDLNTPTPRHRRMVRRYANDLIQMMQQAARVLRPAGRGTYVLGNSCLKDTFIQNSAGVTRAGIHAGLRLVSETERDLPAASRYPPVMATGKLSKRMRTETILTFSPRAA